MGLTGDDIPRVHGILVFEEAKSVHELDLCNLAGAMGGKVICDILFSGCDTFQSVLCHPEKHNSEAPVMVERDGNQTIRDRG